MFWVSMAEAFIISDNVDNEINGLGTELIDFVHHYEMTA